MSDTTNPTALIIGGGIGGLATAIALKQIGYKVAVYERVSELKEVGAGLSLWINAVKAARDLGLADELQQLSVPQIEGSIRTNKGELLSEVSAEHLKERYGDFNLAVHRAELLDLLRRHVGNENIQLGQRLTHFIQDAGGVTAFFEGGKVAQGDILIGADGLHSAVRTQLSGVLKPRYVGYSSWRAITQFDQTLLKEVIGETWGRGFRMGVVPLSGGRIYWFAVENSAEEAGNLPVNGDAHRRILKHLAGWSPRLSELVSATDEATILKNNIYDLPPFKHWGEGRVTLLGDAAHPTTPNLGQGACMALEDAVVLAKCLKESSDQVVALHRYETLRQSRTARIVKQSRLLGQVGQWQQPLLCNVRNWLLKQLLPGCKIASLTGCLGINCEAELG